MDGLSGVAGQSLSLPQERRLSAQDLRSLERQRAAIAVSSSSMTALQRQPLLRIVAPEAGNQA